MRRYTVLTSAAVASIAAASLLYGPAALAAGAAAGCRVTVRAPNWRAVLGHEPTAARATATVKRLLVSGYKGTKVENRGCGDYAVVIESPEFSKFPVRKAFALETAKAKLIVSFARPSASVAKPGDVIVVFGHRPTLAAAVALLKTVAAAGWRETDVAYGGPGDWTVVWPGVPGARADQVVQDTLKVGLQVELELATP
jgi:hypothetical protein